MQIKEYRITLPLSIEEYQIAQLFTTAETVKHKTDSSEVVILKNEPFHDYPLRSDNNLHSGQYTSKIYHWSSDVPAFLKIISPKNLTDVYEEAWDAYPYCRTVITNPRYEKDNFHISIESIHLPDRGEEKNVHQLPSELLEKREVIRIDIAHDDVIVGNDYRYDEDPTKFQSQITGRGPLRGRSWQESCTPVMTCYKLVICEFKRFGLQNLIERFIQNFERRLFTIFHRQVFCWIDRWHGLTLEHARSLNAGCAMEYLEGKANIMWQQQSEGTVKALKEQENNDCSKHLKAVKRVDG